MPTMAVLVSQHNITQHTVTLGHRAASWHRALQQLYEEEQEEELVEELDKGFGAWASLPSNWDPTTSASSVERRGTGRESANRGILTMISR